MKTLLLLLIMVASCATDVDNAKLHKLEKDGKLIGHKHWYGTTYEVKR